MKNLTEYITEAGFDSHVPGFDYHAQREKTIDKEKFDELQKKQDDLSLKRNNLANEQQKIQKQIDEINKTMLNILMEKSSLHPNKRGKTIDKEKFDELQKKQDDLSLKRNNLADEQQKIQKQIDEINKTMLNILMEKSSLKRK